jgi:hypothetical protein
MGRHRIYPPGQAPSDLKDYYVPRPPRADSLRIDAALGELCDLQIGRPLSQRDIAEYCETSQMLIYKIEKRAKKKLRARLAALGIKSSNFKTLDPRAVLKGID